MALVAQEPVLYSCSIRENILYGCPEDDSDPGATSFYTEEDMVEAAKLLANVHDFMGNAETGTRRSAARRGC